MKWLRRVKAVWKRAQRPSRHSPAPSEHGITRREFLRKSRDVAAVVAAAASLNACALMISREHGYDRDFDTRRPNSSVRKVVESFPDAGTLEVGFIKERKAGRLVGASTYRTPVKTSIAYNNWTRDPRSTLHTHPVERGKDPRLHTFPSPADFHWVMERITGESDHPSTMRTIHVMPITPEGKAMGFSTIRLGKEWLRVEKEHPELVRRAWMYYSTIQQAFAHEAITSEEYARRLTDFFALMEPNGLQVRVTAYPGFKIEKGLFLVPKGE